MFLTGKTARMVRTLITFAVYLNTRKIHLLLITPRTAIEDYGVKAGASKRLGDMLRRHVGL